MNRRRLWVAALPVVGGAGFGFLRHGATGLVVGAVLGAVLAVAEVRHRLIGRLASRVGSLVASGLAWLVVLVVLPGRRVAPPSGWQERSSWDASSRSMVSEPPFPRRARLRLRWLLVGVVWFDFAGGMLLHASADPDGKVSAGNRYEASGVSDPELAQLQRDAESFSFVPYGEVDGVPLWTLSPGATSTLVFDPSSGRRTDRPAGAKPGEAAPLRVALLGASAAFGMGVDDRSTVASELARGFERAGVAAVVENLAMPGFVAEQSVADLTRRLEGGERFDVVVLLTGFNDTFLSMYGDPGVRYMSDRRFLAPGPGSWLSWWADRSLSTFLLGHRRVFDEPPMRRYGGSEHAFLEPDASAAASAVDRIGSSLMTLFSLSDRYGFHAVYGWTPSWVESPGEPDGTGGDVSEMVRERWREVFEEVHGRLVELFPDRVVSPSGVYGQGCFFDLTHHVGRCSEAIAAPLLAASLAAERVPAGAVAPSSSLSGRSGSDESERVSQ